MPNVFDMRQPLPMNIKKKKVMQMWQIMLTPDDDDDDDCGTEDERLAKLQAYMLTLMPNQW